MTISFIALPVFFPLGRPSSYGLYNGLLVAGSSASQVFTGFPITRTFLLHETYDKKVGSEQAK